MDKHSISFFGQSVGMLLNSPGMADGGIFIRMIKKKPETGVWEKPTQQEGKVINLSLGEICSVNQVLDHLEPEWSTIHKHKNIQTKISFKWDKDHKGIWINIGDYGKNLNKGELLIFSKLMAHFEAEKIEFSTHGKKQGD